MKVQEYLENSEIFRKFRKIYENCEMSKNFRKIKKIQESQFISEIIFEISGFVKKIFGDIFYKFQK